VNTASANHLPAFADGSRLGQFPAASADGPTGHPAFNFTPDFNSQKQ
jgi:hypothetical protein